MIENKFGAAYIRNNVRHEDARGSFVWIDKWTYISRKSARFRNNNYTESQNH